MRIAEISKMCHTSKMLQMFRDKLGICMMF